MFIPFIIHHILNRKWSRCVFREKYTLLRIWNTVPYNDRFHVWRGNSLENCIGL